MELKKHFDSKKHNNYNIDNINTLEGYPEIRGYDFEKNFDFKEFIQSMSHTGFQATNIGSAIEIIKSMRREKATIFLGYTSNMVSSGVREIIKFLVKHKFVDVLVTTAGGIEEDIIKCFKPFVVGSFDIPGKTLFEQGINRIGNIFVPNDRYFHFDRFMQKFFEDVYAKSRKEKKEITSRFLISELGKAINNKESIYYWAHKNSIPVFCPALMDGSLGDLSVFFKHKKPDFSIDVVQDMKDMTNLALNCEKSGAIILGGGVSKHYILNANIFREGVDYCVYINTGQEFDGSDSGARPDEAVSWAKIKPNSPKVKVYCDATIVFPLIVAASFKKEFDGK